MCSPEFPCGGSPLRLEHRGPAYEVWACLNGHHFLRGEPPMLTASDRRDGARFGATKRCPGCSREFALTDPHRLCSTCRAKGRVPREKLPQSIRGLDPDFTTEAP